MSDRPLLIFGSGEIASLARFYFENDAGRSVSAFTVDDAYAGSESFDGLPLLPWSEALTRFPPAEADMHVALSYQKQNRLRQEKYEQCRSAGYNLSSYICSKACVWPDLVHGDNCFILEHQVIQPTVRIGCNVMLWSGNHIGHGTEIGDHTYFASHVVVSGHCKIGQRCFFGVNATLRDFLSIGDDCFVAMGAGVTKDMTEGGVALAAASTLLEGDDQRAIKIRNRYFGLSE
jgi:sugar O-acyltransferase (sialic acid O-acetyltransferase NeuD family)